MDDQQRRRPTTPAKGRGAVSNITGRYETLSREAVDDGWALDEELPPRRETVVQPTAARTIISHNESPDIGFDQSINPYLGCEHGCIYCFARPTHAYLNLSPGLDFETRLFTKPNAAELLEAELSKPSYKPRIIALGASTDPYQPIEREHRITRGILEVLDRFRHPVGIVTKGVLIERDLDLLAEMAARKGVGVGLTLTTLAPELKRTLEPRAASSAARLRVIRKLADAGVPVRAMISPIIPFVNDAEMEHLMEAAREAGATAASYVLLRLPHEVAPLFRECLDAHLPLKAEHVMSLINQSRGGKDYDPDWRTRMRGRGAFADLIAQRFKLAQRRLGFTTQPTEFDFSGFRVPERTGDQMGLF